MGFAALRTLAKNPRAIYVVGAIAAQAGLEAI